MCPRCWPASLKSRRSRSTSARPVKPEALYRRREPITLKRRLLNTMGFTKTPRERSSSGRFFYKAPVEAEPVREGVVVSDAGGRRRR